MKNPNIKSEVQREIKKALDKASEQLGMIAYWQKDETNKDESYYLESFGYSQEFEDFCKIEFKVTYIRLLNS